MANARISVGMKRLLLDMALAAGHPQASPLLMPLAEGAGGKLFHPGGKHWTSQDDLEWRVIAEWVRGAQ